jgi:hypothetical protein
VALCAFALPAFSVELTDGDLTGFFKSLADAAVVPANIKDPTATNAMIILANLRIPTPKAG